MHKLINNTIDKVIDKFIANSPITTERGKKYKSR